MGIILRKLPFLLELFFNGSYILLYSLYKSNQLPQYWSIEFINIALNVFSMIIPLIVLMVVVLNYIETSSADQFFRKHIFSFLIFIALSITWGDKEFMFWLSTSHLLSSILSLYNPSKIEKRNVIMHFENSFLSKFRLKPAQAVIMSFFVIISIGSVLLMLPFASVKGSSISFIDAIFTAISATCVTGLSTLSLKSDFTSFGQIVILILIQVGGLGIMTLSSSLTILLGKSMAMKDRVLMQELLDVSSLEDLIVLIADIIKYTLVIEFWGGIILTVAFIYEGFEFGQAIYYGFFHSISAFCNAGFSLFDNSLESFSTNPLINFTIISLVTLGGLGFIVLKELKSSIINKKSLQRLSFHTKIVLVVSFSLTLLGTIIIFFGEFLSGLDGYSLGDKIMISIFQSVTLRTAGFSTVSLSSLQPFTIYIMVMFMFIGASPGSTGGGVKTTTLAILIQSIRATLKGDDDVKIFDRKIPGSVVVRTTALTIISIIICSLFIFLLMNFEKDQSFLTIFFEVVSASGTVGLSLGITPVLSVFGKIIISILMFIGRVGPLTMMLAIGQHGEAKEFTTYPEGRIMIG